MEPLLELTAALRRLADVLESTYGGALALAPHEGPEKDYTCQETAAIIRMSERWLRTQIDAGLVRYERRGHKIFFTPAQLQALRESFTVEPVQQSITTGRKRKAV